MSALKAFLRQVLSTGVVVAAILALGQFVVGCAGSQFPLTQTTFFNVNQTTPGKIGWVANATGDANAYVLSTYVKAQIEIADVQGPPVWVEAIMFPTADQPIVVPIKQQIRSSGFTVAVPDALDFASASKPVPAMIGPLPGGAPPAGRSFVATGILMWKNSFNDRNFNPGEFDPLCICYSRAPTLRAAGSEVFTVFEAVSISFDATYKVESGGGGGGG